jgi:GT2 family glycosyltransferase
MVRSNIAGAPEGSSLWAAFARSGERSFFGFVLDFDDLTRKLTVEIFVDGFPIKVIRADAYVHELARDGVGDGRFGFSFSLHDNVLTGDAIIEARLANVGTQIGTPIEIESDAEPPLNPNSPGMIRWLGGLRFSGWLGGNDEKATADASVDGVIVTRVRPCGWSHVGSSGDDIHAVRAFDLHLPERFADGVPHQLTVVNQDGENVAGSPVTFVAFANGLSELVTSGGTLGQKDPRAAMFDRLWPTSMPFSEYASWSERVSISMDPPIALRGAVIMIGSGSMNDTLESIHEQTHTQWVAASLPETSDAVGFRPELARAFLDGDGSDCDFVVFGLAGTLLAPTTLRRMASVFCEFERAHVIYGDLAITTADGSVWPLALPAFDYERMLEQGYCAHLFALRREAATRSLAAGASNLYRLFNSIFDEGAVSHLDVVHLPGVLATLPKLGHERASAALAVASKAHLRQRGIDARVMPSRGDVFPAARIARHFGHRQTTIVITTRNQRQLLQNCIESIRPAVDEQDAEIIVVDNDSGDPDTVQYLAQIETRLITVLRVPGPFNFARLNNMAIQIARGEVLCLLNNDTEALTKDWLGEMLGRLAEQEVGAVGALLVWPSGVVQHGGIVLGPGFAPTHAFNDRIDGDGGYGDLLRVAHECSAVAAAALVTRRSDYQEAGGMDEMRFPVTFNDVDYCLKLRALGKRVVFTPHAKLVRREAADRGFHRQARHTERFERELQNLRAKWGAVLGADPYYSPLLSLDPIPFSGLAWPARPMRARINSRPVPAAVPSGF